VGEGVNQLKPGDRVIAFVGIGVSPSSSARRPCWLADPGVEDDVAAALR
jgi:hypothetical protein